jgi:ABC-type branched-subunit amino acid transport system substrate-binding protein
MKSGRSLLSLLLFCAILTGAKSTQQHLKIGLLFRFAEQYDGTVPEMVRGIETAIAMYNISHPALQVEVLRFSHQQELSTVMQAIDEAIKAKVDVVIGGEDSDAAIPMSVKFNQSGIVFISPTATNPKVTLGKPSAFSASMSDEHVAAKIEEFVVNHLKARQVGIMRGISSPYTDFLSQEFRKNIEKAQESDPKISITEEKFVRGSLNYSESIKKFHDAKVTHLAMLSYESQFMQLVSQLNQPLLNLGCMPLWAHG